MLITREHIHELLDRTHIASQHAQMALGEHPALDNRPEWKASYTTKRWTNWNRYISRLANTPPRRNERIWPIGISVTHLCPRVFS